jgi:peptidase E
MKLYLSSMHPSNKETLLGLIGKSTALSVTVIPTAWDTYPAERKASEVKEQLAAFKRWGFNTSILELASADRSTIQGSLTGKDLVWVMGETLFTLIILCTKAGSATLLYAS